MSREKPTFRERYQTMKGKLDFTMMLAVALKDDLEFEVDELDVRSAKKKLSPAQVKRYDKLVQAVDDLDRIVGHLCEADDQEVKL